MHAIGKDHSAELEPLAVTVVEAGRLVGLGRTISYRLARDGTWPTIRHGRAVRVPLAALREWVEHETEGGAP
jgi:excisionase family DNA binding protein